LFHRSSLEIGIYQVNSDVLIVDNLLCY